MDYDVTSKVTTVYRDAEKQKPTVSFTYDDRGFRLSKTGYNDDGSAVHRTWYVRDASGNVAGTYEEDIKKSYRAEAYRSSCLCERTHWPLQAGVWLYTI